MLWPKKNSQKEFDNEKELLQLENFPPPQNFSNGPSLTTVNVFTAGVILLIALLPELNLNL